MTNNPYPSNYPTIQDWLDEIEHINKNLDFY